MIYEVTSVYLGMTATWNVDARSTSHARQVAREEIRKVSTNCQIVGVRPLGYRPRDHVGDGNTPNRRVR